MRRVIYFLLLSSFTLLGGCGITSPVVLPPQSEYAIAPMKATTSSARARTPASLLVSMPIASPGYDSPNMVYVNVPFKLREYANNRWVAPPAQMLMPVIAQRIRAKQYFKAVVTPPFSGITNYRVDTQLIMLEQEFLQPASRIHLVMQATVINSASNKVLASKQFSVFTKAPGNDAYSGVLAANKAASIITSQIASFVVRSVG